MFGPVITTETLHVFFRCQNSNNTVETSAMIEALSFLVIHGPYARDANLCFYYDSKHAAGLCLGTIQARTHVQLALAWQRSTLHVQHMLRLDMQNTCAAIQGIWENECADHG